jgi:hypothetical protein
MTAGEAIESGNNTQLPHQTEVVIVAPVFGDPAVGDAEDVDTRNGDGLARGRDAEEVTGLGASHRGPGNDPISLGNQILDLPPLVGKRRPEETNNPQVTGETML